MEIVARVQAISGRKFAMDEVQPINGVPYNSFTAAVQARYQFQTLGVSVEAQQKGSTAPAFEIGEFSVDGIPHAIAGLEFLPDGLRVVSYSTEVADAFISDLLEFAHDAYGYQTQNIKRPATYSSALLIRLQEKELAYFSFLRRSCVLLDDALEASGKSHKSRPFGVRLIASEGSRNSEAVYALEKRAGPEAGDDVYFSQAPLPTAAHERFLGRLFSEV